MAKKTTTTQKLDSKSKTPDELYQEWLRCLEELALALKELKEARVDLRNALAWAERQASGAPKVSRKLLRTYKKEKQASEAARIAMDNEVKAWEASTGLLFGPEERSAPTATDDDQEAGGQGVL